MKARYVEDAEFVNGMWRDLSAWYWEDGTKVDDSELCEKCGKPTKGTWRDDCHICEDCAIDRLTSRIDAAEEDR